MMQIGGVDNLVLKQVELPATKDENEKKVQFGEEQDSAAQKALKDREVKEEEKKNDDTERAVYGDVVGRSTDGDTTRVKQDAMEALETGMVFQKEEKENNLMEFNRDQLTVMLDRGDITDHQYDHEITRRDELMEKDEKSAFAKTNAEMIEKQKEEAEKKAREKARERLDEIQGKGSEEEGENENLQKLEEGMNTLAASTGRLEIEEDAVENAAQNGRSELIDQILNPEDGQLKVIVK